MLKGRAKVGEAATVEALLKDAGSSGILHLACHTKLDPEDSLGSSLVLAPGGSKGLLPAYEIVQKMNLHCNLVTLSACDTGSGFAFAHEGVLGIARAFQLAGARSVLMSMWQVADQSTSLLMRNFYKRLAHGAPKDVALRQAAIETRRKFPQPFYWAPFVLSGDWK